MNDSGFPSPLPSVDVVVPVDADDVVCWMRYEDGGITAAATVMIMDLLLLWDCTWEDNMDDGLMVMTTAEIATNEI